MVRVLLVNPWIYDFAAYNLWARPLGFLTLFSFLRERGHEGVYLDALRLSSDDISRYGLDPPKSRDYGTGKFYEKKVPTPEAYPPIRRYYRRYGQPREVFADKLREIADPDWIFVTSGMTYWYLGIQETIGVLKEQIPDVPVVLGGTYATLCPEHATEKSGADQVISVGWESGQAKLESDGPMFFPPSPVEIDEIPFAANDLYPESPYAVTRLTQGCPFHCDYCASDLLSPGFQYRDPAQVVEEITWNVREGRPDVALYDDALLVQPEKVLIPVLESVLEKELPCSFHTPNGLHARFVSREIAELFCRAQFRTVRLSFEGVRGKARETSDGKAAPEDLERALAYLQEAGYPPGSVDVYSLIGLPGQREDEIYETVDFVHSLGGNVKLAQYSPIPGTPLFEEDKKRNPQVGSEPLLQNPTVAPGWNFETERYEEIKSHVRKLRSNFRNE
ncbi:MAG: radical SAM protein [Planctomycetes bacterium]|nr:radical SAM protein [Planctomycetota bacterium]